MSLMAGVIAAHEYDHLGLICKCGILCGADEDTLTYPAHLAAELAKAGFTLVPNAMREYGAPLNGINGPTGPPIEHGYIRDPNFLTRSTHHRLVTPWQELTKEQA